MMISKHQNIATLNLLKRNPRLTHQHYSLANLFFIPVVFMFLLLSLFDPADQLFNLKLPVFFICWVIVFLACVISKEKIRIPVGLFIYMSLMIAIPLLSIGYYFLMGGGEPFEGFQLLKAYVFISFAVLLYIMKVNLLKYLSTALTILALAIIFLAGLLLIEPSLYMPFYFFGKNFGVFYLDHRDYGSGLVMAQFYFATSPMLVISIAYYFYLAKFSHKKNFYYGVITAVNILALFIAGSRNNMVVSLLLPLSLFFFFSRRKILNSILILIFLGLTVLSFYGEITTLFDSSEFANSLKIALFNDYIDIFSDPVELIFGQGLGSYYYWIAKGTLYFVTELTYFEVIRNFGLLFGSMMILLLVYPIAYAFWLNRAYCEKHIIIGYTFYLVMCATNPNLFSSMGMLILAIIIANIFINQKFLIFGKSLN